MTTGTPVTTSILMITHDGLGQVLIDLSRAIVNPLPTKVEAMQVPFSSATEAMYQRAKKRCDEMEKAGGILILTDLYGSTPGNIATRLYAENRRHVVTGLNLPMLLRALNYCTDNVADLAARAVAGGCDGIREYRP